MDLTVRQLGFQFFIVSYGNIFLGQIQALEGDVIGISFHKYVVIPIPDVAEGTCHTQSQHQGNHNQNGHKCFLQRNDLRFFY